MAKFKAIDFQPLASTKKENLVEFWAYYKL